MQVEISIPDDSFKILDAIVEDLRADFPGSGNGLRKRNTKAFWINEARKWETESAFDVLARVGGHVVGFNTAEIEKPEKETSDCPAYEGSWSAYEAYFFIDLAPGHGFWTELSEWPWLEGYESEILHKILEDMQ